MKRAPLFLAALFSTGRSRHACAQIAPTETTLTVTTSAPVLPPSQPARTVLDEINSTPGWLFEANAVLHPRESEYQTQFLINGIPHTENLSPAFAPPPEGETVELIQTAGYSAALGRSLSGIVTLNESAEPTGTHGSLDLSAASFAGRSATAQLSTNHLVLTAAASSSNRFLDPPAVRNFTNHGHTAYLHAGDALHLGPWQLSANADAANQRNDVPNEGDQQAAGQRQTQASRELDAGVRLSRQWTQTRLDLRDSVLSDTATFTSNSLATPILVSGNRGFLQHFTAAQISGSTGHHTWTTGADLLARPVHERFAYRITDPTQFDPGTQPSLSLAARACDIEPAAYAEDTWTRGPVSLRIGARFDTYRFNLRSHGWSPRASAAYHLAHLTLHADFDRIFQTPAVENLLLAGSPAVASLSTFVRRLPVPIGHANFYQAGAQADLGSITLTSNIFLRKWHNFEDDDTLLNTGLSIPFTDRAADVHGEELSVRTTHGPLTGSVSYTNMVGFARGPVTGGLLLGQRGAHQLADRSAFPISQDQRNTLRAQARWGTSRWWIASSLDFNSGLPVELDPGDPGSAPQLLPFVNLARGRVKPWTSINLGAGTNLSEHLSLQLSAGNLSNGLHLINYASLFSGTALASPRSAQGGLHVQW